MRPRCPGLLAALATLVLGCAAAGPAERAPTSEVPATPASKAEPPSGEVLRVGTSGDYAPFSWTDAQGELAGLDVEIARAYATDRGLSLEWVRFRWSRLHRDLRARRFDVALSGVTVRPERSILGTFTVPTLFSEPLLLVAASGELRQLADLSVPGRRIAVNRGGHLERVARERFPAAELTPVDRNEDVLAVLLEGKADAVVTDSLEAPHWERESPVPLRRIGPLRRDRKAAWVRADLPDLARDLSAWLMAREQDGSLERWRVAAGIEDHPPTASKAPALESAVLERLALMPLVAEAKRRSGGPIDVPEREARVIEAGLAAARLEAGRQGRAAPPADEIEAFYRRQIAAAKRVQRAVLAGPPSPVPPPDLDAELRPALLRIGERIAWLLVQDR